jgi:hypothetical protein
MNTKRDLRENSEAVEAHLTIMQSVIQRMAGNSTSAKTWCITLVSAVLVVVADKGKPQFAWLAVIPTVLFLVLDAYYLGLEKGFRKSYNTFIDKLHGRELKPADLYVVEPEGDLLKLGVEALRSFSVWPFYVTLFIMIYLAKTFVI